MSTDVFPSDSGKVSSKEDVMSLLAGGGNDKKPVKPTETKPTKEPKSAQTVSSKDDVMDLLSGTVKKKESDSGSSNTSLQSNTPSQSNADMYGNAVKNYQTNNLTTQDVDILAQTEFGKQNGLNTLTPSQKDLFVNAHNSPKTSELYGRTLNILNASFPKTDDPKINEQRDNIIKGVTSGNQKDIIAARDKINANIQKKINDLNMLRTSPNPMAGAFPGANSTITNLSPEDENTIASLKSQMQQANETLNSFAVNSMATSKETNAQVQAEVSGKHYSIVPHIAAEDLGKQIEKLHGGLPNPNGNMQYERQRAGLNTIIESKQMRLNDLTTQALKTKNPDIINEANKQAKELQIYKGWQENLIDNFPDVAITQTARLIGDELAESNPRMMIISKNDVEESAKRINQKYPGFIDRYGKFVNVVAESEGSGIGAIKSGLVPKGGLTGGLQTGIEQAMYGGAKAVAGIVGDEKTQQTAETEQQAARLNGTKFSGETPTKVVYDNEGKAFIEKPNEDYGKLNWNSATRFIGTSIPGLAAWVAAEEATGGLAALAGAGKATQATAGLIGASYATSYDENRKYAENLVEDKSSLGEAKKVALANFLTLTTAGVFKMVGYSPAKFVENAITKSVGEDAIQMFEDNGWKSLPKSKVQEFIKDKLLPRVQSFGKNALSSIGEGTKVGAATVADTKIKDFVATAVNPDKAQTSTDEDNIKQFAEQSLFMGLLGLPKAINAGFSSPSMKDAFYDVGTRAPQYIESINQKITSGEYTQEQGNTAIATAKTMAEEVSKAQSETTKDGLPLTLQQKKEIALQNFRKRAAVKLEETGHDVSAEKVKSDADNIVKEVKAQPSHLSTEETHAFKTATEIDKEGNPTGTKVASFEDIDPDKKYTWENNDNKEKKGNGAELISFLTQSKQYEEPDKTIAPEGEKIKGDNKETKGEGSEATDKVKVATDLMLQDINSGKVKTPYKDLLEKQPEHAEGVFQELVQQIKDGNESKLLEDGYSKEFVDAAKDFIQSPKIENNENERSSEKSGSKEKGDASSQAKENVPQGDGEKFLEKGNVKDKEGAGTGLAQTAPSYKPNIRDDYFARGDFFTPEEKEKFKTLDEVGQDKMIDDKREELSGQNKSDADIEKRMMEIEDSNPSFDSPQQNEFNSLEKEMEKRERKSVFDVPLDKVNDSVDALMKKEKEQPNGYGSFIEKRDARETKEIANKYLDPSKISDDEIKNDFKESVMGNPDTWYADGLKLRESLKEAANRGIDTKDMVAKVEEEFVKDGYSPEDAKATVARKLAPIFDSTKLSVDAQLKPTTEEPTRDDTKIISDSNKEQGITEQTREKENVPKDAIQVDNATQPNAAAEALEGSAARLREQGDEEGAAKLEQQANDLRGGDKPPEDVVAEKPKPKEPETVGVSNAAVNERRLGAGLRPVVKEAKRRFKGTWETAKTMVLSGQTEPRSFVADLHSDLKNFSKRSFNDVDNALVLMDRIDLTNQKNDALIQLDKSTKTGNDNVEALAWQQLSEIEQKLQQNDEVADKMGTIQGRALSSRRMLSYLDYSLASMKRDVAKYYKDKAIPKEVLARLEKIETEHAQALNKLQEYEQRWKDEQAKKEFDKNKKPKEKTTEKSIKLKGKELADKIRSFKTDKAALKADFSFGTYDLALEGIAKLVEGGATIANAIDKLLKDKEFGFVSDKDEKEFRNHLSGIEDAPLKSAKETFVEKISELAKNANAETITKDMITPLRRLINDYARNGEENFDKVLTGVHNELKDSFSNLTKEDIRDAYSGYGDVRLDSKKELDSKVKEWKQEATILGQLDDVAKGDVPHKMDAGEKKSKQSERIEKMRSDLEKKMKDAGISWTNTPKTPEEKNERALTSLKSRLQTEINNLTNAIESKTDLTEKGKTNLDEETKALMQQRDVLKETLNHVLGKEGKKTLTDEERVARAEKHLDKQIEGLAKDIEDIKSENYTEKQEAKFPKSVTIDLMRGRRDALRDLKRKLLVDTSPTSSEPAIALENYKDQIRNKLMEYTRRIEDKDFEEKENKKSFTNDAEAHKLEVELKRTQTAFSQEKINALRANRTRLQKFYDKANAWKRFSVLTGIPTIGKLASAVAYRTVGNPIEELTGQALKYIPGIRTVANLAPREGGGINFKAEGSALQQWAKASTYKDAMEVIKKGQGELDYQFGKFVSVPPEALEVMGRLHGAMKNFAKRAEFARSYEKRMQHAIDHGADPADELTQVTAMSQAYIDANRSIFMQDNFLVNAFNKAVQAGEESENKIANLSAAVTRFLLPIVKIPTNFVGESLNYSFGSLRAFEVVGRALTGHLNDMTPEQADGLMRSLKKGSIGLGAMAIGFYMPGVAGGYYVKGLKKENEDNPDWSELEFAGVRIPRWATHFPLFEAMQLGATMREIMNKDIKAGRTSEAAISDGIIKSSKGMIGEVPLFNFPQELVDAADQGEFGNKFIYPEIGSNIPIVAQFSAAQLDTDKNATPVNYFGIPTRPAVKRDPDGFIENMEYRIPGLRQEVPTKEEATQRKKEEREQRKAEANF